MAEPKVEAKAPNVAVSTGAKVPLVVLGALLLVLFAAGIVYDRAVGSEVKETPVPAKEGSTAGAQAEATTKTTKKEVPSETLLTAILASGAALILVGVLYSRISSIKLPGGVEVGLTEKEKEATAEKVAAAMPGAAPQEVADATVAATVKVQQAKAVAIAEAAAPAEAPPAIIEAAVQHATS